MKIYGIPFPLAENGEEISQQTKINIILGASFTLIKKSEGK
jgi:hypothetical protein